jgi:Protein of unknown function (DUF2946)
MRWTVFRQRLGCGIAALALLWSGVAPTVGFAMAKQSHGTDTWLPVCGSTGLRYVKLTDGIANKADGLNERKLPEPVDNNRDCPYCQLGTKGAALLQTRLLIPEQVLLAPAPSLSNTEPSDGGLFWPAPKARAPPQTWIA